MENHEAGIKSPTRNYIFSNLIFINYPHIRNSIFPSWLKMVLTLIAFCWKVFFNRFVLPQRKILFSLKSLQISSAQSLEQDRTSAVV